MDDRRRSANTLAEDLDEFDHLLDDDLDVTSVSHAAMQSSPSAVAVKPAATRRRISLPRRPFVAGAGDVDGRPGDADGRPQIAPDWNRIAAVAFVGLIVLLVLWFAVSSIRGARRASAYRSYFSQVREIASQSTAQGDELDSILTDQDSGDRSQRIGRIEQLGARADKLAARADGLEVPQQLAGPQRWLTTSLHYRARGYDSVQRSLTAATEKVDADKAADSVAGAMARLVASDVVWNDSFAPDARDVLSTDDVGVEVPNSTVVQDLDAVSPKSIAQMLERLKTATGAGSDGVVAVPKDGKVRGGQLESGRVTVAPSGQTLVAGSTTEIKGGEGIVFEVPFTNQGEVQLTDVPVAITLRGDTSDPIELEAAIDTVDPGETATAKVSLDGTPTFGEVLTMDVLVGPIPGEKKTDNNRGTYQVQFSL